MQIKNIVLYSKNKEQRIINFETGKVNIITGASGTGKTAIIDIIEYCLGSSECRVADGIIRETVEWFGLRLQFDDSQIFIARENPPLNQKTTNRAFIKKGDFVEIPKLIKEPNTIIDSIIIDLTSKMGISPNLNIPPINQTRNPIEAKLKQSLYYCFQAQDEIASKNNLFHHQSDTFIKQSIIDTLPYFLGAVQENRLELEYKLRRLKREHKKVLKQLKEIELIQGEGVSKAIGLLAEAQEVGLIKGEINYASNIDNITYIKQLFERIKDLDVENINIDNSQINELRFELRKLQEEYYRKREQLKAAKTFDSRAQGFRRELEQQHSRLETINLYNFGEGTVNKCPICSQELKTNVSLVERVKNNLNKVRINLETTNKERTRLEKYVEKLEEDIENIQNKINIKSQQIKSLLKEKREVQHVRDLQIRGSRVLGRISFWLESFEEDDDILELQRKTDELEEEIKNLENELDYDLKEERIASILNRIGYTMTELSNKLILEHGGNPIRLDYKNTTIIVDKSDRSIPLNKMGSGENWVSYHIIAHLALHKYFIENQRPVPRFLVLDQPTQVYYPKDKDEELEGDIESLEDEDRIAVNNMFNLIFDVATELKGGFQVIIIDHADLKDVTFQEAVIERWRGGKALIPKHWKEKENDSK
ncbi:DUF3732 domain-containing protein [Aneurinibacillus sp. UBA3580]|jgi:energy-coupling factor transporter ATP-binding protein EcfA2|uniref:DUF3732 domain-containing protein n=1 Tax=Aneurinibacillus sp. UBA3580 TaxID=1946041 RepID=UPI00257B5034|nr:DUF3732 domain-containing protein [Aneurinibacillus sp. UBA3580]